MTGTETPGTEIMVNVGAIPTGGTGTARTDNGESRSIETGPETEVLRIETGLVVTRIAEKKAEKQKIILMIDAVLEKETGEVQNEKAAQIGVQLKKKVNL